MAKATTHDEYLAALDAQKREALQRLRETIRRCMPGASERISYGIPTFSVGRPLVGYGAAKRHCAFYLMSSTVLDAFEGELSGYDRSKGTIRFDPANPLPDALVAALLAARLAEQGCEAPA